MLLFTSLLTTICFVGLAILSLNYAVFLWENKKVNDLTSQIKHPSDDLLSRGASSRNFSSVDLGASVVKNRALQVAGNFYDKAIITFKNQDYPNWLVKFVEELRLIRKNIWSSLQRFFKYLISLTKPPQTDHIEPKSEDIIKKKQAEVEQVVDRVNSMDIEIEEEQPIIEVKKVEPKPHQTHDDSSPNMATIGFAAGNNNKSEKDMNIFEKLESRILEKLKGSGFDQYDIWLELGNLYEKYDEKEKAVEIYALVLKHSDSKEKELARDKLIGLS